MTYLQDIVCIPFQTNFSTDIIKSDEYYLRRRSIRNRCVTIIVQKNMQRRRPWYRERLVDN